MKKWVVIRIHPNWGFQHFALSPTGSAVACRIDSQCSSHTAVSITSHAACCGGTGVLSGSITHAEGRLVTAQDDTVLAHMNRELHEQ